MNQNTRTAVFIGAAIASLLIAAGTHYANKPADIKDFSDVGEEFYANFKDPNEATALQVASYNAATGKTDTFKVDSKDGLWRIPSHHNYPADAKDRLARTAASMIGVKREALVGRSAADHKRLGLLDPLNKETTGTEGRGDRITLYKGDEPLADFIVGKKADEGGNRYYVRRANEDRSYKADLGKLEVSTKFADWILQDVLEISRNDVREVFIDRYYVDEAKGRVVPQDKIKLTRPDSSGNWTMQGLNSETEQVKTSEVNAMLGVLDDLKIVGVRPKPEDLREGLKNPEGPIAIDPLFTQADLQEKGFFIAKGRFISNEGEVQVGTNQGVLYGLGFGEEFSGSDVDIEVGSKKKSPAAEGNKEAAAGDAEKKTENADVTHPAGDNAKSEEKKPEDQLKEGEKKSRYVFVTVHFDKELLGPPPEPPKKPEAPPESTADKPQTEKPAPDAAAADLSASSAATPENNKPDPKQAYQDALKKYEEEQTVYTIKKKDYDKKLEDGEKRVADLNRRFADWFYVISEDSFARLKLKREDLIEKKTAPAEKPGAKPEAVEQSFSTEGLPEIVPGDTSAAPANPGEQPNPSTEDAAPATPADQPNTPPGGAATPSSPPAETPPKSDAAP